MGLRTATLAPPAPVAAEGRTRDGVTLLTAVAALLFLVPSYLVFRPLGSVGTPAGILALGALWLWVVGRIVPRSGLATGRQPVRVVMLLFALSTLASYAAAFDRAMFPVEARGADRALIMVAGGAGVALLAADGIRTRALLDRLLKRITILVTIVALVGIVQFVSGFDLAAAIRIPGLGAQEEGGQFIATRHIFRRVSGTTAHGIEFSVVLTMALPLALHYAWQAGQDRRRWLWWGAAAMLGSAIPMSVSRTGTIGLLMVGLMLYPTWDRPRRRVALVLGAVFAVAMKLVFPGLLGTIKGLFLSFGVDTSVAARQTDYGYIMDFVSRAPLFGRGMGTFLPTLYTFLDNQYLMTLVEGGVVGLVALFVLYLGGMGIARGARHRSADAGTRELGQTLAACISVALVTSAAYDFLGFPTSRGFLFLLIGCAGALWRFSDQEQRARRAREAQTTGARRAQAEPVLQPA